MAWFRREKRYDRARIMAAAAKARRRRKHQKALLLYRQVLEREPDNPDLHRKVAPLLAATRQESQAWTAYRTAAERLVRQGFVEQAIGVFREATGYLPRRVEVWISLAELEVGRNRPLDAHKALLDARHHFRGRKQRADAIQLLMRARKLDPRHFDTSFELAGLLARSGARVRAQRLLDELASWVQGRKLRRVRGRQFGLAPSPASGWRWMRAALGLR
jgi:tetratricopeptide (TPR) repeat protein